MKLAMLFTSGASKGRWPGYHDEHGSGAGRLSVELSSVVLEYDGRWDFAFHLWPWGLE